MKRNDYYSDNFITCELRGRTGNMMFEVAHAFAKSLEFNRQLVVPRIDYLKNNILRKFDMVDFNYPYENMELIDYPFHFVEKNSPSLIKPTIYRGYFQSEKYIQKYENVIKSFYRPTEEFILRAYNEFPFLKDSSVGVVNVRRGDYLLQSARHPVITIEYINEAIKHLPKCDYYFVLSDDLNWCKENIKLNNVYFIDNYWDNEGIWLMSLCSHFVISNSTFSWWGAFLSNYENKVVVSPDTWFGVEIQENSDDIYCNGWIKIPTYYENGLIKLKN